MKRSDYAQVFDLLAKKQTKFAECIKITRLDGKIFRFTSHDQPLTIKEPTGHYEIYESADSFVLTSLETGNGLVVSNMDIDGLIDDDSISNEELRLGLFDHANIDLYLAYWGDRTVKVLPLRTSWIGEVQIDGPRYKVDLRGLAQRLAQTFVNATSLDCRYTFCDSKCGLDVSNFEETYTVSSTESDDTFTVPVSSGKWENFYQWGKCIFLSGLNEGLEMEILRHWETRVQLFLPMPYPVTAGDSVTLRAGCSKTWSQCVEFNNYRRFGGEPFLASGDMLTRYPVRGGGGGG